MSPTTYMAEKQAGHIAYEIVKKVVKARLPKGCSFDKVSTSWRVEHHLGYFSKLVINKH